MLCYVLCIYYYIGVNITVKPIYTKLNFTYYTMINIINNVLTHNNYFL